jgi:S-adenosylmethionine hydrolase
MLTDFGARDPSAGIMHAVVVTIAPEALIVDISHEVEKFHVRDGALLLWSAAPYLPQGAHVAVVDPGVGTERRAIAIETSRGDFLVGPDNGLLLPAAGRLGGITRVQLLANPQYRLPVISSSFHGRDLFAPAAAHLAMGLPLEYLGPSLDPRSLVMLDWPEPEVYAGILRSQVIYLDTFGNVKLSALASDLQAALGYLQIGERIWVRLTDGLGSQDVEVTWADTFGRVPVGQALLTEDSYGRLSLAINQGSAVQAIGIREDAEVLVTRQPLPRIEDGLPAMEPVMVPQVPAWAGDPGAGPWQPPMPDQTGPWGPPPDQGGPWGPPPGTPGDPWGPPPGPPPGAPPADPWGPPPADPWGPPPGATGQPGPRDGG